MRSYKRALTVARLGDEVELSGHRADTPVYWEIWETRGGEIVRPLLRGLLGPFCDYSRPDAGGL